MPDQETEVIDVNTTEDDVSMMLDIEENKTVNSIQQLFSKPKGNRVSDFIRYNRLIVL